MPGIETRSFSGHQMVKIPDLGIWASRGPFTQIDWQSNALRLHHEGRRFGVLVEIRVGDESRHSLHSLQIRENGNMPHRMGRSLLLTERSMW